MDLSKVNLATLTIEHAIEIENELARRGTFIGAMMTRPPKEEAPSPQSPAQIYAHYKSLCGEPRLAYLEKHKSTIWDYYTATRA